MNILLISMELLNTFKTIVLMILSVMLIDFKLASVLGVMVPLLPKTTGRTFASLILYLSFIWLMTGR